jgi:hypothetical protein
MWATEILRNLYYACVCVCVCSGLALADGAPRLQAAQVQLQKDRITQALERKIDSRPDKDDLLRSNILKGLLYNVRYYRCW